MVSLFGCGYMSLSSIHLTLTLAPKNNGLFLVEVKKNEAVCLRDSTGRCCDLFGIWQYFLLCDERVVDLLALNSHEH